MPWQCTRCHAAVPRDDIPCPACGAVKTAWSMVARRTRAFVVAQKKFELLRGTGERPLRADDPAQAETEVAPAEEVRSTPKAGLRRLLSEGLLPASRDVLFVRLFPRGSKELTVTITAAFAAQESRDVEVAPLAEVTGDAVDVPLLFVHGEGDASDLQLAGLHVVDIAEATELGHAPSVELKALKRPSRSLPVRSQAAGGLGLVLPGALFAFDSAFPTPSILWHLVAIDEALAARPDARLAVFGHADPTGSADHNKRLSDRRAQAVLALLTGDLAALDRVAEAEGWGPLQDQAMLRALGCDPGPIDGQAGPLTRDAVRGFQREYSAGGHHEAGARPRAHPDLAVDGELGPRTRAALRDAYLALSPVVIPAERIGGPRAAGCSEFNLAGTGDPADDRRVVVALLPAEAAAAPAPCREGDASACALDAGPPRRCGYYRRQVLEEVRVEAPRFWDFLWLREADGRAHLTALTSLPDGAPVRFTVHRCTTGVPSPPPESTSGAPRPAPGPALGTVEGRVAGGVAFARWTPPAGYCPFTRACWHPADDAAEPEEMAELLARPGLEPPVFIVEGGGHWACSEPPGRRLSRVRFPQDGPALALAADGQLVRFEVKGGRAVLEDDLVIVDLLPEGGGLVGAAAAGEDAA